MTITSILLELSSSHIQPKTNQWLSDEEQGILIVYEKHIYGYWIQVPEAEVDLKNVPNDLQDILQYASQLGCSWIMLDSDVPVIDQLPTYIWE